MFLLGVMPRIAPHPVCDHFSSRIAAYPNSEERQKACDVLAWAAELRGFDVPLVVELAWGESGFGPRAVNPVSGCAGVLQVSTRYWCPKGSRYCNLQAAGFRALGYYLKQYRDETTALCHFKSGSRCKPLGLKGAQNTMQRVHRLRKQIARDSP